MKDEKWIENRRRDFPPAVEILSFCIPPVPDQQAYGEQAEEFRDGRKNDAGAGQEGEGKKGSEGY